MLELPHAILGATIATKVGNPFFSLPLAFLTHFLLDLLPHWNPHIYTEMTTKGQVSKKSILIIFLDAFLALVVGSILAFRFWPDFNRVAIILLAAFVAVAPDLVEVPYFFWHSQNELLLKIIKWQHKIQWKTAPLIGIITQVITLLLCFLILQ